MNFNSYNYYFGIHTFNGIGGGNRKKGSGSTGTQTGGSTDTQTGGNGGTQTGGTDGAQTGGNGGTQTPPAPVKQEITLTETENGYDLKVDGASVGEIKLPYDNFLKDVSYEQEGSILKFTFDLEAGEKVVDVELSSLVDEYLAGDGITLEDKKFAVKLNPDTEEYLVLDADGLKLDGLDAKLEEFLTTEDAEATFVKKDAIAGIVAEEVARVTGGIVPSGDSQGMTEETADAKYVKKEDLEAFKTEIEGDLAEFAEETLPTKIDERLEEKLAPAITAKIEEVLPAKVVELATPIVEPIVTPIVDGKIATAKGEIKDSITAELEPKLQALTEKAEEVRTYTYRKTAEITNGIPTTVKNILKENPEGFIKELKLEQTQASEDTVTYTLSGNGGAELGRIEVPKDKSVETFTFDSAENKLVLSTANGGEISLNASEFVKDYKNGNGISITGDVIALNPELISKIEEIDTIKGSIQDLNGISRSEAEQLVGTSIEAALSPVQQNAAQLREEVNGISSEIAPLKANYDTLVSRLNQIPPTFEEFVTETELSEKGFITETEARDLFVLKTEYNELEGRLQTLEANYQNVLSNLRNLTTLITDLGDRGLIDAGTYPNT